MTPPAALGPTEVGMMWSELQFLDHVRHRKYTMFRDRSVTVEFTDNITVTFQQWADVQQQARSPHSVVSPWDVRTHGAPSYRDRFENMLVTLLHSQRSMQRLEGPYHSPSIIKPADILLELFH